MSSYADITPAWMVKCMEPHIEDYMRVIPVSTFMGLQSCDYSGYIEQYPELGAFDMSSISATDFITAMPPGKGLGRVGEGLGATRSSCLAG